MKINPALKFKDSMEFIKNKVNNFFTRTAGALLNEKENCLTYKISYSTLVFYGVEAIRLTKRQTKEINDLQIVS